MLSPMWGSRFCQYLVWSFHCTVDLLLHPGSENLDIVLGQDWFNFCMTALQDVSDERWLVFSASPFHAVFAQSQVSTILIPLFIFC